MLTAMRQGTKPRRFFYCSMLLVSSLLLLRTPAFAQPSVTRFPADKARNVNPDTHLVLTFPTAPVLGKSGQIRIYDAADNKLVDTLDLSIPPGPTAGAQVRLRHTHRRHTSTPPRIRQMPTRRPGTPSGVAVPTSRDYQLTIIGGFTDGFHFYPVIIHDNVATIYPHNNLLKYNKTYYVQIDPGVLTLADGSFKGIGGTAGWTFTTKKTRACRELRTRGRLGRRQRRFQYRAGRNRFRSGPQPAARHDLHSKRQLRRDRLFPQQDRT